MHPYAPNNDKGRTVGGHDIHHRTADQHKAGANASAKVMRHAARQDGRRQIAAEISDGNMPK